MPQTPPTQPPQAVVIRGFLVISRLPSKALLDTTLPEIFKDVKIGRKEIRLVIGYFYNKLGSLSRKFYTQILPRYAVYAGFGYIVPRDKAPEFLKAVDELKREYAKFEKQLKAFLLTGEVPAEVRANKRARIEPEYLKLVREYLEKQGAWEKVKQKIEKLSIVERVTINLLPFAIDMSILEEYVDERVRKRIEQELYEVKKQMVVAVEQQLREKLRRVVEKVEKYAEQQYISKAMLDGLRSNLAEIEKVASEFDIHLPELETLKEMLGTPIEDVGKKLLEAKASGRLKALLEELG